MFSCICSVLWFLLCEYIDKELSQYDVDRDFEKMLTIYVRYYAMREDNYMAIESGGKVKYF